MNARLQGKINRITTKAFDEWEMHHEARALEAVPHLKKTLPSLSKVNGQYDNRGPLLTYLTDRLQNEIWPKHFACQTLGEMGDSAIALAIPVLLPLLKNVEQIVRLSACAALGNMGEHTSALAVNALQPLLEDPDEKSYVRIAACKALAKMGGSATVLLPLLKDKESQVRITACEALGMMGEGAATLAIPALLPLLEDLDELVSIAAREAIGIMAGSPAALAIPALPLLLEDSRRPAGKTPRNKARSSAHLAVNALVQLLKDNDWRVRSSACEELGDRGSAAALAISALLPLLKDSDLDVCFAAGQALGKWQQDSHLRLFQRKTKPVRESLEVGSGEEQVGECRVVPVWQLILGYHPWPVEPLSRRVEIQERLAALERERQLLIDELAELT